MGDQGSSFKEHTKHIIGENTSCIVCHDPHASDKPRLINFDTSVVSPYNGTLEFNWTSPGNGSCTLMCHGEGHDNWDY